MGVTTEPPWLNSSKGVAAANGTNTHVIDFTTDGDAPFTPAAGSLLVVVVYGGVTHAASGWNERLSPVSSGELSVFTKDSAPDTSITVTHNASNYMMPWQAFELPAGSTYTDGAGSNQGDDSWSTLGGLSGAEQVIIAARGRVNASSAATSADTAWAGPWVEDADLFTAYVSGNDHGYLTVAHQINFTGTGITPVQGTTYGGTWGVGDRQNVVFAIDAVAPSSTTPFQKDVSLTWNVLNTFTKDVPMTWHVLNIFTKDVVMTWRVLNAFVKDTSLTWNVLNAFAKDTALAWNLLNTFARDQDLSWRVLSNFQADYPLAWRVLNAFTADKVLTWSVLSDTSFAKTVVFSWNVVDEFTADTVLRWRVLSLTPDPPLPADAVAYLKDSAVANLGAERAVAYL
jgi:hypothetical protein